MTSQLRIGTLVSGGKIDGSIIDWTQPQRLGHHGNSLTPRVLFLTQGTIDPHAGLSGSAVANLRHCGFAELDGELRAPQPPDVLLCPLMGLGWDIFDAAETALAAGFGGLFRGVTRDAPNPALIKRDLAAAFPGLYTGVVVVLPGGMLEPV
ncbi:MAG: hypothetical protein AAGF74_10095 [Pseudomonadota bacterium]